MWCRAHTASIELFLLQVNQFKSNDFFLGLGPKLSKDTIFFHFDVLRPPQKPTCCPDTKMPHQNSLLDILLFDSGQSCVDLRPIGNYNLQTFSMGLKLYRVTIFFGSHVPNFLEALSSLVLLFSDLQGRLRVIRMRKMPHRNLSSIAFFLPQINTVSIWAPWKITIFDGAQTL